MQIQLSTSPSQYTDTELASPSIDPISPIAWQSSHWSASFEVTGMTRPGKIPHQAGFEPRIFLPRGGRLNHLANEAVGTGDLNFAFPDRVIPVFFFFFFYRLVGLVIRRPPGERKIPGSNPARAPGVFRGRVIPVTSKLALQWLPCQAPGVIGSALGLVGPVSVYCDWVRWKV